MTNYIQETDEILWTFNGTKVDPKGIKYIVEKNSFNCKLKIKDIRLDDEGEYAVEVNGSKSCAYLIVNGNL